MYIALAIASRKPRAFYLAGVCQYDLPPGLRHLDLPDDAELVPVGGGAGREFSALHPPGFFDALGGGEDLALAVAGVQGVHGLIELRGTDRLGGSEEIALSGRTGAFQPEEHDAGLAVSRSGDERGRARGDPRPGCPR